MAKGQTWTARRTRFMNRLHVSMAGRAPVATGFVSSPEPRTIGHFARGRQLLAGNFMLSGRLVEAPDTLIWDIAAEEAPFVDDLHGFAWLDDLAAVGDAKSRERAQTWVMNWIDRYGKGQGPGWTPALTGRRLIRWINHALLLLRGRDKESADRFYASLSRQTVYLSRRWRRAPQGLPRFEALTGMIHAGLSLEGMQDHVEPAIAALAADCQAHIGPQGDIPSRNPEELLEVFTLLIWASATLNEAGRTLPTELVEALSRIAPTLRALRHSDGGLGRFHGGGAGIDGRLDHALAASGNRRMRKGGLHMGYARIAAARTSVIIDAAKPASGRDSGEAHASTLAFEMTSGRRPVIVNCGSGAPFGPEWRRAGRATPSHSTLGIEGTSSSRMAPAKIVRGQQVELFSEGPERVGCEMRHAEGSQKLELSHDGWRAHLGLTHARIMELSNDGRALAGEDILTTLSPGDERAFDTMMAATSLQGAPFSIRFHLHPDVDASVDLGGTAISLALKSGEVWIFRHDGKARLTLEPSIYLEKGRLKPRSCDQVVLSGRAIAYATRVRWSLAKAQGTPDAVRDYAPGGRGLEYAPPGRIGTGDDDLK